MTVGPKIIAVVDRDNATVKLLDHSGKLLKSFSGKDQSSLVKPFDAAFLPNGALVVTDSEAGKVLVFDWTGHFITELPGDFRHPRGITLDMKRQEIVFVDGLLQQIFVYDANSCKPKRTVKPISTKDTQGPRNILVDPCYIAVSPSGNYIVADIVSPHVKIVTSCEGQTGDIQGEQLLLAETMDYGAREEEALRPGGVVTDKYGQILVVDVMNGRVHRALPNGRVVGVVESDGLRNPLCLGLDAGGRLLVAQAGGAIHVLKYV